MKTFVIATTHSWNISNAEKLRVRFPSYNIKIISNMEALTVSFLEAACPEYVFFPHWSWIVPSDIYEKYKCVVFHMTDLPFGRGGSPLQNLISRGITETKISAIQMAKALDAGDIYLKEPLNLYGGAEEIYIRASEIIFSKMIPYIIENKPVAVPQYGDVTSFARRTPNMSEMSSDMTIGQLFDHIRMLDAEGYPKAFINFGGYSIKFSRPKRTFKGIIADVEIEEASSDD